MLTPTVITYDGLPISSGGGHKLRFRSALEALRQIHQFIASCTNVASPETASLEIVSGGGLPVNFCASLIMKLTNEHGAPKEKLADATSRCRQWVISSSQLEHYCALTDELKPLPEHAFLSQPIAVTAFYKFHLLAPNSLSTLPGQGSANFGNFSPGYSQFLGESHLYARFSERSTVSLFLNFPTEPDSTIFSDTLARLRSHLPFKLSSHHWKRWQLSKKGTSYVGRKIAIP